MSAERVTTIYGRAEQLYELFKPNEHLSRDRYYFGSGTMLRHEQYDDHGRLKRIVTYRNYRLPVRALTPHSMTICCLRTRRHCGYWGATSTTVFMTLTSKVKPNWFAMGWSDKHRISPISKPRHLDFTYVIYGARRC